MGCLYPVRLTLFLHILVIVTMINIITKRLHIPSASVLILAGIASTLYSPQSPMMITPEMFTALLLPPIIFQETFHTDVKELIKDSDSNGVTMAPIIGELVAQSLCEGETVDLLKPFDPLRFLILFYSIKQDVFLSKVSIIFNVSLCLTSSSVTS